METASPQLVGSAIPYSYLGDSHASVIGTLVFEDPATSTRIVTRTSGIRGFCAADVLNSDLTIGDGLAFELRMLRAFQVTKTAPQLSGFRSVMTTYGTEKRPENLELLSNANDFPYVLCVGELDVRHAIQQLANEKIDFAVPFATDGLEQLEPFEARQMVRADKMLTLLGEQFKPLFIGLRLLRNAGLRSIFLHCLTPPTLDDEEALRLHKTPNPAILRYKLTMFVNYLFEAVCRDVGIGFVNTWSAVTERNLLRREFYLDGVHLNREHAKLSVAEVHRQMSRLQAAVS